MHDFVHSLHPSLGSFTKWETDHRPCRWFPLAPRFPHLADGGLRGRRAPGAVWRTWWPDWFALFLDVCWFLHSFLWVDIQFFVVGFHPFVQCFPAMVFLCSIEVVLEIRASSFHSLHFAQKWFVFSVCQRGLLSLLTSILIQYHNHLRHTWYSVWQGVLHFCLKHLAQKAKPLLNSSPKPFPSVSEELIFVTSSYDSKKKKTRVKPAPAPREARHLLQIGYGRWRQGHLSPEKVG